MRDKPNILTLHVENVHSAVVLCKLVSCDQLASIVGV